MAEVEFTSIKDSLDIRILKSLDKCPKITAYKISQSVSEPESKVIYRLRRLISGGLIVEHNDSNKKLYSLDTAIIHMEDNEIIISTRTFTIKFDLNEIYDMEKEYAVKK